MQCRKVFSYCLVRRSRGPAKDKCGDSSPFATLRVRMTTSGLVSVDSDLQSRPHRERERRVADGADMLLAEQVIELGEDGHPALDGIHQVGVELGVAEVEIAVR